MFDFLTHLSSQNFNMQQKGSPPYVLLLSPRINEKIEAEEAKISEGSQAEFDEAIDITL